MTDHAFALRLGPATFAIRSPFADIIARTSQFYRDYPQHPDDEIVDFALRLSPASWLRRFLRTSLRIDADFMIDEAAPVERRLSLMALEMGLNMQMALGYRRDIVLHAASAAHDLNGHEAGLIIIGDSGAGKSTLSVLLSYAAGWRHMGDEIALLAMDEPLRLRPYPRPVGLKNSSIPVMHAHAPADRFGPRLENTMKGTVQHLLPPLDSIRQMNRPAPPAMILAPQFQDGASPRARRIPQSEAFLRLSVSSTNHARLGERGFDALIRLVRNVPAYDIIYGSGEDALKLVGDLWADL